MSQYPPSLERALQQYLDLLHQGAYFDAHEILEEAWHPLRKAQDPLANLVKGMINASIAFEHLKRNRHDAPRKARKVMASYERHKHLLVRGIRHYRLFDKACQKIEFIKRTNEVFRVPML